MNSYATHINVIEPRDLAGKTSRIVVHEDTMEGSEEYTRVVLSVATPIQLWLSLITKVHTKFTLTAINSGNVCEWGI